MSDGGAVVGHARQVVIVEPDAMGAGEAGAKQTEIVDM